MKTYKGNLLDTGVNFAFALVFIGILLGAGAIALASFASGQTGSAASTIGNASSGLVNLSTQLPTVGTIAGVGLIILVLFTAIGSYVFGNKQ
jgi:hypothetical protein